MMFNLRDIYRTQLCSDILITEYVPYNPNSGNITYIPFNGFGVPMVAFEEVPLYSQEGDTYVTPYTTTYEKYVMPKDLYINQLQQLIQYLEQITPGTRVTIKGDYDDMYLRYQTLMDVVPVAGVISIFPVGQIPTYETKGVITFTPPEGVKQLLGFDSYCVAAKVMLPMVHWDFTTLYVSYQQYKSSKAHEGKEPQEYGFWFMIQPRNLNTMSTIVDNAGAGMFTKEQLIAHLKGQMELDLSEFCKNMLLNYNQNPVGIDKLLMYSSKVVPTAYAAAKRNADILRDDIWILSWADDILRPNVTSSETKFDDTSLI